MRIKQIVFLDHHEKSVTGGHLYNDDFERYLEKISNFRFVFTPSCAKKYYGWRKIISPLAELRWVKLFKKDTLLMFGDTSYKHHFLLALLNKWLIKSPSAMIVHHFPFVEQRGLLWKVNKWFMCRYVTLIDSIIVPSPFTLDVVKSIFSDKKIFYIPLPFAQIFNKSINYEQGNLLYVGTIEERKGLSYLIEALALLDNRDSIKLNIVGKIVDQSYYNILKQIIDARNLTSNINFLGRVSNEKLNECYQKAEIFTFPSLLEGYGIVLIEAFNNALPIICFDNTAMPYTVKDNVNGLVAKNKDIYDLAEKIKLLIGNKPLREKLQEGIEKTINNLKQKKDFEEGVEFFYQYVSNSYS